MRNESIRIDQLEERIDKLEAQLKKLEQRLLWLDADKRDGVEGI